MEWIWIALAFGVVAFVYSSAGLGGGSAYLAILALAGLSAKQLPLISLSCNLLVAGLAFYGYARNGYLRWKLVAPFVLTSVPFSFLGGQIHVGESLFRVLLAFSLWMAAGFFLYKRDPFVVTRSLSHSEIWKWALPCGAALGLLSGMVGIGGGIFLIPLLLILGLATTKEAAAAGSFFILVNSFSGLAGRILSQPLPLETIWPLWLAVLIGGALGGSMGAGRFSPIAVQRVFAGIVVWAAWKIATGG